MTDVRYENKNVLITGGLGFLGSSLAHELVASGAKVTVVDNLNPLYGGNLFNVHDIRGDIEPTSSSTWPPRSATSTAWPSRSRTWTSTRKRRSGSLRAAGP